jgi:hypothetical protein
LSDRNKERIRKTYLANVAAEGTKALKSLFT